MDHVLKQPVSLSSGRKLKKDLLWTTEGHNKSQFWHRQGLALLQKRQEIIVDHPEVKWLSVCPGT